jgi:hypothetical protein
MKIQELEYRGLNLMDVVGTVEVAIDATNNRIHLYDTQQIVEPEYQFQTKSYTFSEGFFKFANILKQKQFLLNNHEKNIEDWVAKYMWIFYCSNQSIKVFHDGNVIIPTKNQLQEQENLYYSKYINRMELE